MARPGQKAEEPAGTVEVEEFSSNRIHLHAVVEGKDPAWLVYADAWHPGWKATVDGRTVPIVRANLGFKAIPIESGTHDVRLQFDPRLRTCVTWCFALVETVFGLTLCCALAVCVIREVIELSGDHNDAVITVGHEMGGLVFREDMVPRIQIEDRTKVT